MILFFCAGRIDTSGWGAGVLSDLLFSTLLFLLLLNLLVGGLATIFGARGGPACSGPCRLARLGGHWWRGPEILPRWCEQGDFPVDIDGPILGAWKEAEG